MPGDVKWGLGQLPDRDATGKSHNTTKKMGLLRRSLVPSQVGCWKALCTKKPSRQSGRALGKAPLIFSMVLRPL